MLKKHLHFLFIGLCGFMLAACGGGIRIGGGFYPPPPSQPVFQQPAGVVVPQPIAPSLQAVPTALGAPPWASAPNACARSASGAPEFNIPTSIRPLKEGERYPCNGCGEQVPEGAPGWTGWCVYHEHSYKPPASKYRRPLTRPRPIVKYIPAKGGTECHFPPGVQGECRVLPQSKQTTTTVGVPSVPNPPMAPK